MLLFGALAAARIVTGPRDALRAIAFWWRHGPISKEEADRIDRIRFPKKYLVQVNAAKQP